MWRPQGDETGCQLGVTALEAVLWLETVEIFEITRLNEAWSSCLKLRI